MTKIPVLTTGPPPAAPIHTVLSVPEIHLLTAAIIKSSRAQTDCSSSLTVLVPMMLENGDLHGLPSATPSPYTLCAHWMVGSCSNSTYVTQQTGVITRSTNVIGSNFTDTRTFTIPHYPARPISFAHLISLTNLHSITIFCRFGNGSISHILILTFTAHSRLLPFADAKHVIASLKMIGTSFGNILICFKIPPPVLTFQLTRFMSIVAPT